MDTKIKRDKEGNIITKVFKKKTHTNNYVKIDSHHPIANERAVVRTLQTRAERTCTEKKDLEKELELESKWLSKEILQQRQEGRKV